MRKMRKISLSQYFLLFSCWRKYYFIRFISINSPYDYLSSDMRFIQEYLLQHEGNEKNQYFTVFSVFLTLEKISFHEVCTKVFSLNIPIYWYIICGGLIVSMLSNLRWQCESEFFVRMGVTKTCIYDYSTLMQLNVRSILAVWQVY